MHINRKIKKEAIETFTFTDRELITILVTHINNELGKNTGFYTAIRVDDCIFDRYGCGDCVVESKRVVINENN